MRHLIGLGHRRIGYVGGSLEDQLDFAAPLDRLTGYRDAMAEAALPMEPVLGGGRRLHRPRRARGDPAAARGRPACPLLSSRRPTRWRSGAVHAVREAGLRVPEDVSVIGIDDHEMAEFFELTTVAQPVHEQGRLAAMLLLEALDEEPRPAGHPPAITVPTRLVVRRTTAPPRSAEAPGVPETAPQASTIQA